MRIRSLLVGSAAVAAFAGVSMAQAANIEKAPAFDVGSFFTPAQFADDGSVYGVRARNAASTPHETITVLAASGSPKNTTTPDPCATAPFPGGWCETAHTIATTAFGWDSHAGGKGVIIGMIDTGIDLNHVEFKGRVLPGTCIVWSLNPCTLPDDKLGGDDAVFPVGDDTHGTHTAGIAAGANVGIANQASILPVKVCSSTSNACNNVGDGIVWAAQHGASVISVSIGGPFLDSSETAKLKTAVAAGSLLVFSAGNSGSYNPAGGDYSGDALIDGIRGSEIVVGATGAGGVGGLGTVASFSQVPGNRCEIQGGKRYCLKDYFVTAPGLDIWSSVGNGTATASEYGYLSGTSMAAPYVAGTATVIKGMWPTLTSSQIASIIFQTADDIGAPGVDPVYGRGAVDITKALGPAGKAIVANKSFAISAMNADGSMSAASSVANMNGDANADARLAKLGVEGAQKSLVSGALSVALRYSTILKKAIVIDSFGRTFNADLSKSVYNPGLDFSNYFLASAFTSDTPFAFAGNGPLGQFVATGYVENTVTPRLLSGELLTADRNRVKVRDLEFSTALADGVDLNGGYNVDLQGRFNGYDLQGSGAYDGLFVSTSAMNSPYESFTNGGNFVGATMALASDLHVHMGASSLGIQHDDYQVPVFSYLTQVQGQRTNLDQRTASNAMVGMDWDFATWGGLGLTASNTNEQHGLLGGVNSGSLAMAGNANTSAVGLSARVGFGDGWVTTVSYSEGITQLDLKSSSLLSNSDLLHSRAYGVAVAKHGLFADSDSLGLAVSRPVQIYAGGVNLTAATSVDSSGNLLTSSEHVSLASGTPETDFEMGYVTTFFDGALALQANAAWQQNLAGQSGVNSLAVLSRAKVNF